MHQKVKELLLGDKPCFIGKIGNVELMHFYPAFFHNKIVNAGNLLTTSAGLNFQNEYHFYLWVEDFARALNNIDCLLAWNKNEAEDFIIKNLCKNPLLTTEFPDIEPFSHGEEGWHYGLVDKKVLVVSSFKDSIELQLPNFHKIWPHARIGQTKVIRMPHPHQITGENPRYYNDVLWGLGEQISHEDFDICIIGAGGYSLPLCDLVKRMGKRAIHLGGAAQVLFGIRGNRFDRNFADQPWYGTEHFIRPLKTDTPKFHYLAENGDYW